MSARLATMIQWLQNPSIAFQMAGKHSWLSCVAAVLLCTSLTACGPESMRVDGGVADEEEESAEEPQRSVGVATQGLMEGPQVIYAAQDTFVDSAEPGTQHGNKGYICAESDSTRERWGYIQFNVPNVPQPSSAVIRLYGYNGSGDDFQLFVLKDGATWDENTLLWNQPVGELTSFASAIPSVADKWHGFDVTQFVEPNKPLTIVFRALWQGNAPDAWCVRSRDYDPIGNTLTPRLVLSHYGMLPVDDTYVSSSAPGPFGSASTITVEKAPASASAPASERRAYFKFDFGEAFANSFGPSDQIARVLLRLYVTNGAAATSAIVFGLNDHSWHEADLVWQGSPVPDGVGGVGVEVARISKTVANSWVDVDVTNWIKAANLSETDHQVSFALVATSGDAVTVRSTESGVNQPHLLVLRKRPTFSVCGDGVCTTGETCTECPGDCGGPCPQGGHTGGYIPVWGDMHAHPIGDPGKYDTNTCGEDAGVRDACLDKFVQYARDVEKLDFLVVTDHINGQLGTNPRFTSDYWTAMKQAVLDRTLDEKFVVSLGFERQLGEAELPLERSHTNILFADDLSDPTVLDPALGTSWQTPYINKNSYYAMLSWVTADVIGQINHPASGGSAPELDTDHPWRNFSTTSVWAPFARDRLALIEMGHKPSTEKYDLALKNGWHVSPVHNSDAHMNEGPTVSPAAQYEEGRAGLFVRGLFRADLRAAVYERRSFATIENRKALVVLRANGYWMGSHLTLPAGTGPTISVETVDYEGVAKPTKIVLHAGGPEGWTSQPWSDITALNCSNASAGACSGTFTLPAPPASTWLYAEAIFEDIGLEKTRQHVFSAPIWFNEPN